MPPALVIIRRGRVFLPLPTVVLWPLLGLGLLTACVILPLVPLKGTSALQRARLPLACWRILSALRGLHVEVQDARGAKVLVSFF